VFPYIAEIKEQVVVLNLNHPLAGKTLLFDVRIVDITRDDGQPAIELSAMKEEGD
jgi:FKBP-type peptidyl-prolyl cis-trans isomerase 2